MILFNISLKNIQKMKRQERKRCIDIHTKLNLYRLMKEKQIFLRKT